MPRAIWNGHVSFGLVEIPVSLVSATKTEETISFNLLDRRDMGPIGNLRINKLTQEPVPAEDIVKGYEVERGTFVTLTDEEIKKANVEASQTVEILAFVDAEEIEPVYFDEPYYLAPSGKTNRAYVLFREALRKAGKVGIAKVVLRTRQRVAAVTVRGPALLLHLLRYGHEVREPSELDLPSEGGKDAKPGAKEMEMAERLIDEMTEPGFPFSEQRDEYRDHLLKLIARKAKEGGTEVVAEDVPKRAKREVIDLMPLLERSMAGRKGGAARKAVSAAPPRSRRKTARRRGA
jgi:DNA end-binding protein Ku